MGIMPELENLKSGPTWTDYKRPQTYLPLTADLKTDAVIIGGGLTGILTAYILSLSGREAVVLEARRVGEGATEYTTAFLTQSIDTNVRDLETMFGAQTARVIWQSHGAAIDYIEQIITSEHIDCEFTRCPNYIYANNQRQSDELLEQFQVMQRLGLQAELNPRANFNFENYGILALPNQAKFHPLKFLHKLADVASRKGARIFEHTKVATINNISGITLQTNNGALVAAKDLIIATYDPLGNPKETFGKKGMYDSYVLEARIPQNLIPPAIFEDLDNPYHYFRVDKLANGYDRIIIGGEDHRSELPVSREKSFRALSDYLNKILSGNQVLVRKWDGPILEPSDGLALIGEYKKNHFIATAFSGNGMTYSGISALILRDLILGEVNEWAEIYNPRRRPTLKQFAIKFKDYAEEWLGGAIKNTVKYR